MSNTVFNTLKIAKNADTELIYIFNNYSSSPNGL